MLIGDNTERKDAIMTIEQTLSRAWATLQHRFWTTENHRELRAAYDKLTTLAHELTARDIR